MCCLRGALGPWTPLSDVCPRVFPALTVHWHLTGSTTHRASLQICQMTAVWSKNWEAPGHLCYYYPHTAALGLWHTPLKLPLIISLQLSQKRLQRVWSGSFIVTSVCVFSVEIPDRFESPDLLEPDCWTVEQRLIDAPCPNWRRWEEQKLTLWNILKRKIRLGRIHVTGDIGDRISRMNAVQWMQQLVTC